MAYLLFTMLVTVTTLIGQYGRSRKPMIDVDKLDWQDNRLSCDSTF
jgi:hypothetical protein